MFPSGKCTSGGSATNEATPSSYIGYVSYLATQGDPATRRNMLREVESPHWETTSMLYLYTCKVHNSPCLNLQAEFTSLQKPRGFWRWITPSPPLLWMNREIWLETIIIVVLDYTGQKLISGLFEYTRFIIACRTEMTCSTPLNELIILPHYCFPS